MNHPAAAPPPTQAERMTSPAKSHARLAVAAQPGGASTAPPGALLFVVPLLFMLSTSLKAMRPDRPPLPELIPNPVIWLNYPDVFLRLRVRKYFVNTLLIVIPAIVGRRRFSRHRWRPMPARLRAPGKNVIFMVLLSTMMLPSAVTLVPTYILFAKLGWVGGFKPLVVPALAGSAFLFSQC
ncbi:MAG: hypothetical protein R2911_19955 [Caldilineaceae bacterium]